MHVHVPSLNAGLMGVVEWSIAWASEVGGGGGCETRVRENLLEI